MDNTVLLNNLISRYPKLESAEKQILSAANSLIGCYENGNKLLVCGNGGSSSDSDHIVGELMKGFEHKRPLDRIFKKQLLESGGERGAYLAENLQKGFPAISLSAHTGLITATANDTDASLIYAQQVVGYGTAGDILLAISTSGNSQNIIDALIAARAKGMLNIGMTGESGGKMKSLCDILINVPETRTAFIQELHLPVYHALCLIVENHFFGN
jgi:D-sedoheptulose 7-phosphate isomerase